MDKERQCDSALQVWVVHHSDVYHFFLMSLVLISYLTLSNTHPFPTHPSLYVSVKTTHRLLKRN